MRILLAVGVLLAAAFGDVTRTVCASGADYATPSALEAAYTTDLGPIGIVTADICAGTFDVTGLIVDGQTNTSATAYIMWQGRGYSSTIWNVTSGTYGIRANTSYHRFALLGITSSGSSVALTSFAPGVRVSRSVVRQAKNGGAALSAEGAAGATLLVYGTAIMCSGTGTTYGLYALSNGNTLTSYNVSITGCAQGYTSFDAGTTTTINNTAFNVTTAFTGSSTYSVNYNACKNTGCNGANSLNSVSAVNFPSDSIHITKASSLWAVGTNLSGTVTYDVDGQYWTANAKVAGTPRYSIGADNPGPFFFPWVRRAFGSHF